MGEGAERPSCRVRAGYYWWHLIGRNHHLLGNVKLRFVVSPGSSFPEQLGRAPLEFMSQGLVRPGNCWGTRRSLVGWRIRASLRGNIRRGRRKRALGGVNRKTVTKDKFNSYTTNRYRFRLPDRLLVGRGEVTPAYESK